MSITSTEYKLDQEDALYTTTEAGTYLRVSPRTLEALRVKGGGPRYTKPLGRVLYRKSDLDAYLAGGLRTSTSDTGAERNRR